MAEIENTIEKLKASLKHVVNSVPQVMLDGPDSDEGYTELATILVMKLSQQGLYIITSEKYDSMTTTIRSLNEGLDNPIFED